MEETKAFACELAISNHAVDNHISMSTWHRKGDGLTFRKWHLHTNDGSVDVKIDSGDPGVAIQNMDRLRGRINDHTYGGRLGLKKQYQDDKKQHGDLLHLS